MMFYGTLKSNIDRGLWHWSILLISVPLQPLALVNIAFKRSIAAIGIGEYCF
jgi:hypothetical protein